MSEETKSTADEETPAVESEEEELETEAPPNETKIDAFRRLAQKRWPAAVKKIRLVANLGGPAYEHTEEQANRIVESLEHEVANVKTALGLAKEDYDL